MSRPFRVALVNLCENTYGYGAGASEYLKAQLVATPDLADEVEVEIFFLESATPEAVADRVLDASPDLVGFSCYSWNLKASGLASREIRRRDAKLPIVWGGCCFSHLRRRHDWFEWWDAVDAVAIGFGELTLTDLVRHLSKGGHLDACRPGLVVPRDGTLDFGPGARLPARLDDLPSPYAGGTAAPVARPYIEMARGCLFECTFCSDAKTSRDGVFATRSVDRIADDIAEVVGWPEAEWVDAGASTANVTTAAFLDACAAIKKGDPAQRLVYSFQLYPSLVREEQRSGLEGIRIGKMLIGLQSTSPATFRPMKRGGRLEHLRRAVSILEGTGPLYVSVILGLPGETLESFRQMFDDLVELEGIYISVHRLLILPGTHMHTYHDKLGLSFAPETFYRATASSHMSRDDLRRAQEYVMERGARLPRLSERGGARVDWTNFDAQVGAFDSPSVADVVSTGDT